MITQTLSSLQIVKYSKQYFKRIQMDEFIEITGLKSLATQALLLNKILEAGKKLLFGKHLGRPFVYTDVCIAITTILQSVWNLSEEKIIQRFYDNPEYALAAGYPVVDGELNIIHPANYNRRKNKLSNFVFVICFILLVRYLIKKRIISLKDIIVDATTIWMADDRDLEAKYCRYKKVWGYKLHLIIDRVSMLPVMFGITTANRHDSIMAVPLLVLILICYGIKPLIFRADSGYDTKWIRGFVTFILNAIAIIPKNYRKQGARKKLVPHPTAKWFKIINGPRSTIERVFGLLKQHRQLEKHYLVGFNKVARHCCLKLIAMLLVALTAHQIHRPDLALSPNKVLAHT